jgi:peptidoglycan/LPS O-acetylase OafA/YrhL
LSETTYPIYRRQQHALQPKHKLNEIEVADGKSVTDFLYLMSPSFSEKPNNSRRTVLAFTESSWAILAGMRFFLSVIVFVGHLNQLFAYVPPTLKVFLPLGGRAAVLGFLLISGISIGHSYIERPAAYFQRRFLRIYPLYFFAVCLTILLIATMGSPYPLPGITMVATHWKTNLANFFFLQGFASITISYNGPLWTLSMEVFYYLLAPLLVRMQMFALVALVLASMLLFAYFPNEWLFGYGAARYAWPWLIGLIIAVRGPSKTIALVAALGILTTAINKTDTGEALSWFTFAFVAAMVFVADRLTIPIKIRRALNFLGEQSYPLYLFHVPLYLALYHFAGIRNAWCLMTATIISVVLLDYVLDHWLKTRFWKPMLQFLSRPESFAWICKRAKSDV